MIIEGEPTLHPEFDDILLQLRRKFPKTPIILTTNGTLLTKERIAHLTTLAPLELNFSLNLIDKAARIKWLGAKENSDVSQVAKWLTEAKINWNGSIVALPHLTGLQPIKETIDHLVENKCRFIRVFLPGFSRLADQSLHMPEKTAHFFRQWILSLAAEGIPITCEPGDFTEESLIISAIIPLSAAAAAGIKAGDQIVVINGKIPVFTSEVMAILRDSQSVKLQFKRDNTHFEVELHYENGISGLIFTEDVNSKQLKKLQDRIQRFSEESLLLITSENAYPLFTRLLESHENLMIKKAVNRFFHGSIKVAGLLTLADVKLAIQEAQQAGFTGNRVFLPPVMFNHQGRDLTGMGSWELEEELELEFIIL
jgi:NifB/MoaA-like Fe-S oxidoreductase